MRNGPLTKKIKDAVRRQRELATDSAWELDGTAVSLAGVAEWMSMERRCCLFLTLQVEASGYGPDFASNLIGPEGVKAFLASQFGVDKVE
ncbi:MAG: hypothetical protein B7X34_07485 [Acidobacteriia bacterium 12-62-4]|nr:MAG: hypothetical protein B7X34_07485 [Acidobacteriia bacterium 12-62-4]